MVRSAVNLKFYCTLHLTKCYNKVKFFQHEFYSFTGHEPENVSWEKDIPYYLNQLLSVMWDSFLNTRPRVVMCSHLIRAFKHPPTTTDLEPSISLTVSGEGETTITR